MAALSISDVPDHDSLGNDQYLILYPVTEPISTGPGTSQGIVSASKLDTAVPSATPKGRMLTMVLFSESNETYAVTPYPETYEVS